MASHCDVSGVTKNASAKEIKTAFRKLSMEHHPDVSNSSCSEKFKLTSEAHRLLSNARERQACEAAGNGPLPISGSLDFDFNIGTIKVQRFGTKFFTTSGKLSCS
mmetsp:Transcript_7850/g.11298  ORF Transcript_7850/g.11298 Transcript_7850/m.11298 type:complete len:105 (-) Transcript_7850:384-698(-)